MAESIVTIADWHTELTTRRSAVWNIVTENDCDLGLVFGSEGHGEPFRYLTNFTPVIGDMWAIIREGGDMACVLNFDWQLEEARRIAGIEEWYGQFDPLPVLLDLVKAAAPRRIGVVGLHRLPVTSYEALRDALPDVEFKDIGQDVTRLRRHKSALEIRLLREAGRITDAAFDTIRGELRPGQTEQEVATRVAYIMQSMGAALSFPPTVISGNDDPIAIRMPTARKLQRGDSVMLDIGAEFQGYQADASRSFVLGKPNAQQRQVWSVVQAAYNAALEQVRPGVPCIESHRAAAAVIEEAGYTLVHRIGHGIGLATSFEWPSLISETAPFEPGMTVCIEPGIYFAGVGNLKLEDDLVITEAGYELLTRTSHELVIAL